MSFEFVCRSCGSICPVINRSVYCKKCNRGIDIDLNFVFDIKEKNERGV